MNEQSKAAQRRAVDWHFANLYFVGSGLDIGAGSDGISKSRHLFPRMTEIREWDKKDGDAQVLDGLAKESFDWVHASHCLEHMESPHLAFLAWSGVLRKNGHMIITVPDFDMYERRQWPSRFSSEHKTAWTMNSNLIGSETPIAPVPEFLSITRYTHTLERLSVIRKHFNPDLPISVDQTLGPAECAIEIVLRKS